MLDEEFDLVRLVETQRGMVFKFGDVLVARGSTRQSASRAGLAGRGVEDEIAGIARGLGLETAARTWFTGRNGRTAPCDLAVMAGEKVAIAVAAKGFDSTGLGFPAGPARPRTGTRGRIMLSAADREEISRGIAENAEGQVIAARIGRSASVVSRDITRHGGRDRYRAVHAGRDAQTSRSRPKTRKLRCPPGAARRGGRSVARRVLLGPGRGPVALRTPW